MWKFNIQISDFRERWNLTHRFTRSFILTHKSGVHQELLLCVCVSGCVCVCVCQRVGSLPVEGFSRNTDGSGRQRQPSVWDKVNSNLCNRYWSEQRSTPITAAALNERRSLESKLISARSFTWCNRCCETSESPLVNAKHPHFLLQFYIFYFFSFIPSWWGMSYFTLLILSNYAEALGRIRILNRNRSNPTLL